MREDWIEMTEPSAPENPLALLTVGVTHQPAHGPIAQRLDLLARDLHTGDILLWTIIAGGGYRKTWELPIVDVHEGDWADCDGQHHGEIITVSGDHGRFELPYEFDAPVHVCRWTA